MSYPGLAQYILHQGYMNADWQDGGYDLTVPDIVALSSATVDLTSTPPSPEVTTWYQEEGELKTDISIPSLLNTSRIQPATAGAKLWH